MTPLMIDSSRKPDRVKKNVVEVTSSFPHCKPSQTHLLDEFALGSKRLSVVERDHNLGGLIVNVRLKLGCQIISTRALKSQDHSTV